MGSLCKCQKCGETFTDDVIVSDEIWLKISPKPVDGYKSGGLLCGQCIADSIQSMPSPSNKYAHMNHHHELTEGHEIVYFGDGEFVANKEAIPLLRALNEAGLKTRTHHISNDSENRFISILLDGVSVEIRQVNEAHSTRDKYNGKFELLIQWTNNFPTNV